MKHRTPSHMRSFYQEDGRCSGDRQTKMQKKVAMSTSSGDIVTISDQEAELVQKKSTRKCKHCSAPTALDSYFYCKKHKPKGEDDQGDLIYAGVSGEH